ncbi:uncharacterized protein N7458_002547 [Penicillium daleae]|uniref:Uncharacterized protein n=1 Tax=Penicillium daleae TaxID=63821 RepID=A0AAD6CD14_9EURO|nr:uncharacterized protein N7458_002547 [Penicillium daleae]KAJ5460995.1 hypothetical protein N7458_002547 [Penicillium daleae]
MELIVFYLDVEDVTSLTRSSVQLFSKLRLFTLRLNIKYRNSNLLHLAAKCNNRLLFQDLINHGANINSFYRGETVLMRAIKHSSVAVIKLLYKQPNLDTRLKNSKQKDALWYVVRYAGFSIAKNLLEKVLHQSGLALHKQYGQAGTALHLAVFWGRIGIARMLLLRGANLDIKNYVGHSPRDLAIQANRAPMVELITSHPLLPVAFRQQILESDDLPLHQAISYGSPKAIKQLLGERKDDLQRYDRNGHTPLDLAVRMNSPGLVDLLLSHPGIDPNPISKNGNTPLWMVSGSQYDEITKRFLRHEGVDINFIGGRGKYDTPLSSLHHAILRLDTTILQAWLETPGVDVNQKAGGQSPLELAVKFGRNDALKMLLDFPGIALNARGGDPPLCQAVEIGTLKTVQLLVSQDEKLLVNERTCLIGDTALCIAARHGNVEIVRALSQHVHLNPNLENNHFEHPLLLAARRGNTQVVSELLQDSRLSTRSMKDASRTGNSLVRSAIQHQIDLHRRFEEPAKE